MNDEIADLQARLTYQEEEIRSLNLVVAGQARELARVKRGLERLAESLRDMTPAQASMAADEPPPPHY